MSFKIIFTIELYLIIFNYIHNTITGLHIEIKHASKYCVNITHK